MRRLAGKLLPVLLFILCCPALGSGKTLVGVIMTGDIPYYSAMHQAFVERLKADLPPGEEVEFILQRPYPDPIAWSNAARKLIAIEVDLIVSYGAPATQAVLYEKSKIPVVYAGVYEPDAGEYKGAAVTGCGYKVPLSSLLRYFKRIREMKTLHVIYSSNEEDSVRQMTELYTLAKEQDIHLEKLDMRSHEDLRKLKSIGRQDSVYITGSGLAHIWIEDILKMLWEKRVPAVDVFPDPRELGLLITLFQPPEDQGRKAAELAAKIIGGQRVGDIPPVLLRSTELVFNLKEANKLGINFPLQLIVEATKVIK